MKYHQIEEGIFISRPNRFIAHVCIDGQEQICHVKNTGRCRELLVPGARVLVERAQNTNRKTRYDLVQIYKGDRLINMDSQMPNSLAEEWIREHAVFPDLKTLVREKTYGNSRFDLYGEYQNRRFFMEVKGVTLEVDGQARFPDAPTERGLKHIRELIRCVKDGYEAWILFVIQMKGVDRFAPNWLTQPEFGKALREAAAAGVHIEARDCRVSRGEIRIDQPIPIDLEYPMQQD